MTHTNSKCLFVGDFCLSNGELTMHPHMSSMRPCAKHGLAKFPSYTLPFVTIFQVVFVFLSV